MNTSATLDLPKHINPNPARTASAPYNFVPLPDVVVKAVEKADDLPNHDSYGNAQYQNTGYFEVTLTTRSPIYVRCPVTLTDFLRQERDEDRNLPFRKQVKNTPHFFYTHDPNQPVIPGSSLRGMLRNLLEIVSYSKVQWVTDSFKIFYRAVAATKDDPLSEPYRKLLGKSGNKVRAGYLVKKDGEWWIKPAQKPADMRWPNREEYLKIKEIYIREQDLPELIRFNSPDYKPQYHSVSFEVKVREGTRGKLAVIDKIGSVDAGYTYRGVLVCSGNMLETGSGNTVSPRKSYALVLEKNPDAKLLRINPQALEDYRDALTPFQTEPPFDRYMGCLVDGQPVFYVEGQNEVVFFGHSPNFRVPAFLDKEKRAATPLDLVPPQLRFPHEIDYTEALFGYTRDGKVDAPQGSKAHAYASRVCVTDATVTNAPDGVWLSIEPITPKILATPKPTAFQHYLTQQNPDKKKELDHYGSPPPHVTVIRGHKLYWHQGKTESYTLDEIRRMIEEDKEILEKVAQQEAQGKPDTQHTQFKPVKHGVTFAFRVYFENLSDEELGALCWVLHPRGDEKKEYCHNLGMGKPLGMGAVKLDATLYRIDRAKRYSSLFDGDNWQTGISQHEVRLSDRNTLKQLTEKFEQHVLGVLKPNKPCPHLFGMKRIGMLLKMLEWPGFPPQLLLTPDNRFLVDQNRPNTRYMGIQLSNVPSDQQNEYRDRPVLPDPSAFGELIGDAEPTIPDETDSKKKSPNEVTEDARPAPVSSSSPKTVEKINRLSQIATKRVPRRIETKRESVTIVSAIKGNKARVRTEQSEEIPCTGFPAYPSGQVSEQCRADVTRENGQAVAAIFKGWK